MTEGSRIGLLGGSFNPAHRGHREISLVALKALNLDAVWWLVSPGNPLKDKSTYRPYSDRMNDARKVADHDRIIVSNFEERRGLQYTIDTLSALIDDHPAVDFVWLMGADSLASFHQWKDWRKIAALIPIAVFNRPGDEKAAQDAQAAKELAAFQLREEDAGLLAGSEAPAWLFVSSTNNPLSSTEIRNRQP